MKLEIGKRYVRNDGDITAPLIETPYDPDKYPFVDQYEGHFHAYYEDGTSCINCEDSKLIKEYVENMKIGDKVKCIDVFDSRHLEKWKTYTIVDINDYNNIGLKDVSKNCLLPHYYKQNRFVPVPDIKVGQKWKIDDRFAQGTYIVADCGNCKYALINLETGTRWSNPQSNKDNIFGNDFNKFQLIH